MGAFIAKIGQPRTVEDFSALVNAVIDDKAYKSITGYIELGKNSIECALEFGGNYSNEKGYFIEPTVFTTTDPKHQLLQEEIFGPVLTIYVYEDSTFWETLDILNETSPYGLTGALLCDTKHEEYLKARKKLRDTVGNFYVNDKPTGAVVGQQPFGGSRMSGTNDKAGSYLNLVRWTSPQSVKENLSPPKSFEYDFMLPYEDNPE